MNAVKAIVSKIFKSFNLKAVSKQEVIKEEEPVFMTLEEAKQNPVLVNQMDYQLNNAKLTIGSSDNYVAGIKFKGHQYYISGTPEEWKLFFGVGQNKRKPADN